MANAMMTAALTALVALLPTMVLSEAPIPVSDCEFMQSYGPDTYYEDHADLGAGIIIYVERSDDYGTAVVADCFSGSTLTIDSTSQGVKKVRDFVLGAAASTEKWSLPTLREHFSSAGAWTSLEIQSVEHCACAAFYPEAKGRKRGWMARYGHP